MYHHPRETSIEAAEAAIEQAKKVGPMINNIRTKIGKYMHH